MFDNITFGRYYPIESKLHDINPITKIICIFIFLMASLFANNIYLYITLTIFTILLIYISKVPIKYFINSIKSLSILIIFVFIFDLIINSNILESIVVVLRIILIVSYTSILMYTTSPTEITYGLEKVLSPLKIFKIPVRDLALILSLAIRFIPIILIQADKILKSQASRGIDFRHSNIKGKLLALNSMLIPMFILSFKRADELATAMEIRLYGCYSKRTNYRLTPWTESDNTMLVMHMGVLIFIIISEVIIL